MRTKEIGMQNDSASSLTIRGGDDWTAEELSDLITSFYILYNRALVLSAKRYRSAGGLVHQLYASRGRVRPEDKLIVSSLSIASPMELNFRGTGGLLKQVRELTKDLTGRNRIEREMLQEDLDRQKDANRIASAKAKMELIQMAAQAIDAMDASPKERVKVLSAILDPAIDAANIIESKGLKLTDDS